MKVGESSQASAGRLKPSELSAGLPAGPPQSVMGPRLFNPQNVMELMASTPGESPRSPVDLLGVIRGPQQSLSIPFLPPLPHEDVTTKEVYQHPKTLTERKKKKQVALGL